MHRYLFWALLIVACLPGRVEAWGKTGHRVIGMIAEEYLSDDSKAAIEKILGVEDLAEASVWADFMRSDDDEFWRRTAGPFHYVTIPKGKRYSDSTPPPQGDGITALRRFSTILRDDAASLEDKQLALRFMVHIVGDLHQPLHAGNGTDRGGNQFTVVYHGEVTNLHRVWDTSMIDEEQLSYTEYGTWLLRKVTPDDAAAWMDVDPVVWVTESAKIRDEIYPGGDRNLRWDYFFEHRDTVRLRLTQGGIRLAAYLNALFAE
ncbi:MAG: S1/P1 nuclease [Woeseiaceae bacterium]